MNQEVDTEAWTRDVPWLDRADADIEGYVAALQVLPKYDLLEKLKCWHSNGFVIFEGAVSHSVIEQYLSDINVLIQNYKEYDIPTEVRGVQLSSRDLDTFPADMTGVKLNHMHCFSKAAARLSLTPHVVDFLNHVFQGHTSVCQSLTFWRGSEQRIHIDYPYVRQQKRLSYLAASWVPLEDVQSDAGPLAYYPGGHRTDVSGFFDWGEGSIVMDENATRNPDQFADYLESRMEMAAIKPKVFCPRLGDVLIWHGNLPHEGTRVNNPYATRKSYVTHYTSEEALPDWMRNFDANGSPQGVFENGGFSYRYPWFNGVSTLPSWEA